jgi:hypothetical protein
MDAYPAGREGAQRAGRDLTEIHSVAPLFVPIVGSVVDPFEVRPYSTNPGSDYIVRKCRGSASAFHGDIVRR